MALYSTRLDEASEQGLIADARARKVSPAPRFASLIGVIENGPGNLSERTGEAFAGITAATQSRARTTPPKTASPRGR